MSLYVFNQHLPIFPYLPIKKKYSKNDSLLLLLMETAWITPAEWMFPVHASTRIKKFGLGQVLSIKLCPSDYDFCCQYTLHKAHPTWVVLIYSYIYSLIFLLFIKVSYFRDYYMSFQFFPPDLCVVLIDSIYSFMAVADVKCPACQ